MTFSTSLSWEGWVIDTGYVEQLHLRLCLALFPFTMEFPGHVLTWHPFTPAVDLLKVLNLAPGLALPHTLMFPLTMYSWKTPEPFLGPLQRWTFPRSVHVYPLFMTPNGWQWEHSFSFFLVLFFVCLFSKTGFLCTTALADLELALIDQAILELTEIHPPASAS